MMLSFSARPLVRKILLYSAVAMLVPFCRAQADSGDGWFSRATATQAEQPHWMTPLVTVTPRLEEEYRFDNFWSNGVGPTQINYGGGKGLEIIPSERVEIIFMAPPYIAHRQPGVNDGLGDMGFLVKYRLFAANEQHGNYIVTLFMAATAPTGSIGNTAGQAMFTPTLAAGKGWGKFDVQSTASYTFPAANAVKLGTPFTWNTAFQYHLFQRLWPEIELNPTWWMNGEQRGKKTVYITPGVIVGRIPIHKRVALAFGGGVQIAATEYHAYAHRYVATVRLPF
jgi:hypothetical protein